MISGMNGMIISMNGVKSIEMEFTSSLTQATELALQQSPIQLLKLKRSAVQLLKVVIVFYDYQP